jgi:hypothetical protein
VTNPRRLIALLFAFGWLLRFVLFPSRGETRAFDFDRLNRATSLLPNVDLGRILDALVFAAFAFISFFLALGSLSTRNSFRPADVDVLFPTPVEPKLVLVFRIFRDYLLTLLAPLFFVIIGYRPASMGLRSLQNSAADPELIQRTVRIAVLAWLLVALTWVCINYAASLFVNRSDLASNRNRRILSWALAILAVGICGYVAYQATTFHTWQDWVGLAENPILRAVFFSATFAMWMVHGVVHSDMATILLGAGSLLAITFLCIKIALTQAGWMYDQAAVKGFDAIDARKLQQSGDTIGLIAAQARQGRVKAGRLNWLSKRVVRGPAALLWKEGLIGFRSTMFLVVLFFAITVFVTLLPLLATNDRSGAGYVFLGFQGMGVFMSASALSQAGFIEMLRRVDVQKPLPFSFSTTVFYEVLAKAIPGILSAWLCSILGIILSPSIWQYAIASALAMPSLAVLICLMTCLTTILFPDFEDPSQRGFRGMMNFVGVVVACAPGTLAFIALIAIGLSPILCGLLTLAINLGISAAVASICGTQYAQFNPSE